MKTRFHPAIAVVAILLAYGIAGRIDYDTERALAAERSQGTAPVIVVEARP